jgi:predicted ribosomally synthesized peptide with SipW-like signal peptide
VNRRLNASLALRLALLAGGTLAAATDVATAHHSIAMFDRDHPIELVGAVQEFRFASPHTFILLEVKGAGADPVVWSLEGYSPNSLAWDGWSNKTLKPGDKLRMTIEPLRSGSPGGAWNPRKVTHVDGTPIVTSRW